MSSGIGITIVSRLNINSPNSQGYHTVYAFYDCKGQKHKEFPPPQLGGYQIIPIETSGFEYIKSYFQAKENIIHPIKSLTKDNFSIIIHNTDGTKLKINNLNRQFDIATQQFQLYADEVEIFNLPVSETNLIMKNQQIARFTKVCHHIKKKNQSSVISDYPLFEIPAFLSKDPCKSLINWAESPVTRKLKDTSNNTDSSNKFNAVSREYPTEYRNNSRILFKSTGLANLLWKQLETVISASDYEGARPTGFGTGSAYSGSWKPVAVNNMFRLARYKANPPDKQENNPEEQFSKHQDVGFCAHNDYRSIFSFIIYLNDGFQGGETVFYNNESKTDIETKSNNDNNNSITVLPHCGRLVVFDHSMWHKGNPLKYSNNDDKSTNNNNNTKYILRGDIMFTRIGVLTPKETKSIAANPLFYQVRHLYEQTVLAAQNHNPSLSTSIFLEAQKSLDVTRIKRYRESEFLSAAGLALLPEAVLFNIFSYISIKELLTRAKVQTLSKFYVYKLLNDDLWRLLLNTKNQISSLIQAEKSILHADNLLNNLPISYRKLYQERVMRYNNIDNMEYTSFMDIGFRTCKYTLFNTEKIQNGKPIPINISPSIGVVEPKDQYEYWGHRHPKDEFDVDCLSYKLYFEFFGYKFPKDKLNWLLPNPNVLLNFEKFLNSEAYAEEFEQRANVKILSAIYRNAVDSLLDEYVSYQGNLKGKVVRELWTCSPYISQAYIDVMPERHYRDKYPGAFKANNFVDSSVLTLLSIGRINGIVIDCGVFAVTISTVLNMRKVNRKIFLLTSKQTIDELDFSHFTEESKEIDYNIDIDKPRDHRPYCSNPECKECENLTDWDPFRPQLEGLTDNKILDIIQILNQSTGAESKLNENDQEIMFVGGRAEYIENRLNTSIHKSMIRYTKANLNKHQQLYCTLYGAHNYQRLGKSTL